MSNITSEGLPFGDTLPQVGFDQLMETDNPEDRILKELVDSVDDESDTALEEFGFEEFIPFAIPEEVEASSVQSSGIATHSSGCNMPDRIQKVAIVSGDLDFVDRFSDAHMKMSPFHGNLVGSDILEAQLRGSREVSANDENRFSKSSGLANGRVEASSLALNPGDIAGPHGGTKGQDTVVQLSYSDLYALCQKQKRDLNKKELGILKMKKLLIEEQQLIVNIRRKRDEAVLDVNRCKEEYCKLDVTHKELLKDYEKMKSEVTSGKLIVQQLGAKISHLSAENKSLQAQIKNNCDPEKIKLKDEVKELSKLVKRNEKTIDSKTDTIQNLRDTLATAQALSEVMKLSINKNSSKGNDLVSVPNSTADVMNQKQVIDLKHMMDEFKAEIYSLIKNVNGAFPAVKTKTKSMFDVSDTEDSETANIRSCTSSIPSYDDDIFEDSFVPSVSSVSPPFSEDLVVSTIETDALSRGDYAKTTINFSPQKHDSKNIPSNKLNLNSDYHVFENKNPVVSVPCLVPCISADNNLGNSGNLDKFGNDKIEIESPCAISERKSHVEELMHTDYRHKYEELPDLTPVASNVDLEGENKPHSFGDSDSFYLPKANPLPVKSESTQMNTTTNPSAETTLASRKNVNLCLSDSDSDDSVSSATNGSTKNLMLCTVLPDKNNVPNSSCINDPAKKVQEEKAVGNNCSSLTEDKCDNSPDDYEYYTDSDCSDSESAEGEHSDSISTLSSSEDDREADSTSTNLQLRPDPVAESSCASLKDIVSTAPPTSSFSLKDDLDLSSEESDTSDEESDLKGSVLFPKSPSKHQFLNDSKIMDFRPIASLSPQKSVTSDEKNQPAEDKHPDSTLNKNKSPNESVVVFSSVSAELTLAIDEKAISSHTKEPCSLVTASPKSSPDKNQIAISGKTFGVTAAPIEASFENKPKIGGRKIPSFSRRVVTKASSNSNVEIPGRTPTLPKIFRRQQLPTEIHGIKRSTPPTTLQDELKGVSGRVEVKIADNNTAYENPAKKMRLSYASQKVATSATTADAVPNKSKSNFFHTVSAFSKKSVADLSESSESDEDDKSMDQVTTVAKSKSIPHPAKTSMSVKDKIKNSMTEIIQVGSGEHMCDKKRMELMAQRQPRVLKPQDKSLSMSQRNINPNTTATSEGYDKSKKGPSDTLPVVCKDNVWKSSKIEVGAQPVAEVCAITKSKEIPNPLDSRTSSTGKNKNSLADLAQESSEKTVVYKKRFLKVQTSPKKESRTQCTPQLNTSTIAKAKDIPSPIETGIIAENKIKNTVEELAPKGRGEALVLKNRFVNVLQTLSKTEGSTKSIPQSGASRLNKLKEILRPKSTRVSAKHKVKIIKNTVAELTSEGTVENVGPEKCVSVVSELPYMEDSSESNPELNTDTITKLKEIPHPIETRMSAKDKIKNSMTDIIQVGSGENMCDKKKLELKAQRTIERLKAEKSSRKDLPSAEPSKSPVIQSSVSDESPRTKVCEKSAHEAFMKSAPVPSVRRLPFLKSGPVAAPQSTITARVTRNSIRTKEKLDSLQLEAAIRRSPRKRNHEKSSSSDGTSPIKNAKPKEEICATSASEACPSSARSSSVNAIISEKDIFNEMFQELGKMACISNSTSSNQTNGTASACDVKPEVKMAKPCLPPKNMNILNLIVGRYSRSLKTEEILFLIGKKLPQLVESPPTEVHVAHKIYSDLTESIESYLLEKIDEQSLIIGCKKICSTICGVKSLLPNLYPNLDVVAVTFFIYQILGKLSYRFDRNDTLHLLGLCYGTICREFSFRDLAFQMLHVVLIKRVRQKSCFAQGFISGYPDIWSFPFERGSVLERSLVIGLTCSPLYCDSIYYKDLRQIFFEGIGLVLPDLSFMQFFSLVWNDFKELEFLKSIEEGEKGLAMLLLQCDWRLSIRVIEEHFNSIYKEWNEKKLSDMIFSSFLRVVGWASELTTDPEPQFSTVQAIFKHLKDAHEDDHELTDLLRHSIADVHEKLGKLAQRGPYNGTELVYYRISDTLEHAKIHDKGDKTERRRVKRKIKRREKGKAKKKEVIGNAQ